VIYVPVYEPAVVYGSWWYPYYPPYYWDWYPGSTLVSGFFWGAGFAIASNLWDWGHCDWDRGDIDIDVNRFNNINVNRPKITNAKWEHNPVHRGAVPYRDKVNREKFAKNNKLKDTRKDFRGFDKDKMDKASVDRVKDKLGDGDASKIKDKVGEGGADRVKDKLGEGGGSKIKDKVGEGGADRVKDKLGEGGASKMKDKAGDRGGQKIQDKAGSAKSKVASRDVKKSGKKVSSNASAKSFDVKPKAQVNRQVNRGNVSRKSAASHRGGGSRSSLGGGGGRRR
jgi:hypothetical protein